jgi:hypothetical protein
MNPIRATRRAASSLTGLAVGLLTLATAAPAALARPWPPSVTPTAPATLRPRPPGWNKHPPLPAHVHPLAAGGISGWQIAIIAAAAVLAATATVVLLARARAARRRAAASPA